MNTSGKSSRPVSGRLFYLERGVYSAPPGGVLRLTRQSLEFSSLTVEARPTHALTHQAARLQRCLFLVVCEVSGFA